MNSATGLTRPERRSSAAVFPARSLPAGFTVLELLVSLAVTLIMMGAVVTIFGLIGDNVSGARATIEMSERLRAAKNLLQRDLAGVTATMMPPLRPEEDQGYFEYVEGPYSDWNIFDPVSGNRDDLTKKNLLDPKELGLTRFGDLDDVLMFTVRSRGEPYVGKYVLSTTTPTMHAVQSPVAEVAWFVRRNPNSSPPNITYNLYRQVRLVIQNPNGDFPNGVRPEPSGSESYTGLECDISARREFGKYDPSAPQPGWFWMTNTLGDLTKREARHGHVWRPGDSNPPIPAEQAFPFHLRYTGIDFPYANVSQAAEPVRGLGPFVSPERSGEDVVLTNVLAFDVRAYDPGAPIRLATDNATAVGPSDPGFWRTNKTAIGQGAYVDLAYNVEPGVSIRDNTIMPPGMPGASVFSGTPDSGSKLYPQQPATYDTWSLHYENDGINQDWDSGVPFKKDTVDQGTNGFDDNNDGVVDDPGEYETSPPYPVPLRGIQVKIRVYEPDSRQVREVTIVQDFLPE